MKSNEIRNETVVNVVEAQEEVGGWFGVNWLLWKATELRGKEIFPEKVSLMFSESKLGRPPAPIETS